MARRPVDDTWDPDAATRADTDASDPEDGGDPSLDRADGDRYDEGSVVGQGGLAEVRSARDRKLGREVAIKRLRHPERRRARARFLREVQVAAQLEHPNIVPVHDVDVDASGAPYYTMRFVRGEPLSVALGRCRDLDARLRLLPKVLSVCQAVAYAHERGIVHRDLKPGNVMLGPFGEAIVVDWGLARILDEADVVEPDAPVTDEVDPLATRVGSVQGTPAFMAPEQARGEAAGPEADVYALGAILYEVLTGQLHREATATVEDQLAAARQGRFAPVATVQPDCPRDLAAIAERALAPDPGDRYGTAEGMARDLERWTQGRFVEAYRYSAGERILHLYRRYRAPVVLAVLGLMATSLATTVGLVRTRAERDRAVASEQVAQEQAAEAHRQSAALLRERAERALREGDDLTARAFAVAALQLEPSVDARGVLMATWEAPVTRLGPSTPLPERCADVLVLPDDGLLCQADHDVYRVAGDGAVVWRVPLERDLRRVLPAMTLDAEGTRVWAPGHDALVALDVTTGAERARVPSQTPRFPVATTAGVWWVEGSRTVRGPNGFRKEFEGSFVAALVPRGDDAPAVLRGTGQLHTLDGEELFASGRVSYGAVLLDDGTAWTLGAASMMLAPGVPPRPLGVDEALAAVRRGQGVIGLGATTGALYVSEGGDPSRLVRIPAPSRGGPVFDVTRSPTGAPRVVRVHDRTAYRYDLDLATPPARVRPEDAYGFAVRSDQRAWLVCKADGAYRIVVDGRQVEGTVDAEGTPEWCAFDGDEAYVLYGSKRLFRVPPEGAEAVPVPFPILSRRTHGDRILYAVHDQVLHEGQDLGQRLVGIEGDRVTTLSYEGGRPRWLYVWTWDGARYTRTTEFELPEGAVAGRSPSLVIVETGGRVELRDGPDVVPLSVAPGTLLGMAPVGADHIATGARDGVLRVWARASGELVARIDLHGGRIGFLEELDEGGLVARTFDGSHHVLSLAGVTTPPDALLEVLRTRDGFEVRDAKLVATD